jgi:hypothetical protein
MGLDKFLVSPINGEGTDGESPAYVFSFARKRVGDHRHGCGNPTGANRGDVIEVIVNPYSAEVDCCVVSVGRYLGMGEPLVRQLRAFE